MDNTLELGALITLLVTNIVSPYITWLLAKKRYYSEVDSNNIKNMNDSLDFWKKACESMREELNIMKGEQKAYKEAREQEANQLRSEIRDLRSEQMAMYQLMCMDLPCKTRQSYLAQGEDAENPFRSGELRKAAERLRMCNSREVTQEAKKPRKKPKEDKPEVE